MRLLVVHPWAGLPARQRLYARLQQVTGWDVHILTAAKWRDEYGSVIQPERYSAFSGALECLPVMLSGNIPLHFFAKSPSKVIRDLDPECIYIYHEPYALMTYQVLAASLKRTGVPIGVYSSQNLNKKYPFPFSRLESRVYRDSSFAVAISESVARVLRDKGYGKPIHIIPMAVDVSRFVPARSTLVSGAPLRLGFAGRLVQEKGIDLAIRTLSLLSPSVARLTIVGEGPQRGDLLKLVEQLGLEQHVTWIDAVPNDLMPDFYRTIDLLVVPSRTTSRWAEQFGRVVIEAAACGVPSLVAESGELPNVVATLGAGWTFPEDDFDALGQLLLELYRDRGRIARASDLVRRNVADGFSEDVIARRFADVIRSSCRGSGVGSASTSGEAEG